MVDSKKFSSELLQGLLRLLFLELTIDFRHLDIRKNYTCNVFEILLFLRPSCWECGTIQVTQLERENRGRP